MTKEQKKPKIDEEVKKLLLWRIEEIPANYKLSIGSEGTFSKEELRQHVENEDEVGQIFAKMQLNFIKSVASGKLSKVLAE